MAATASATPISSWTPANIPDLTGKTAVVTGANIGLGLEIAKQLAAHNAKTILACRNPTKAQSAAETLRQQLHPSMPDITAMQLDVSSLASVRSFATSLQETCDRLDVLVCNAGVMALPERELSVDGFEMQFATNHLGHFALVGELLPLLRQTEGSRVVTQSSSANWMGSFDWADLNAEKRYDRWRQYCFTKLANVAFANELNRRLQAANVKHPVAFSVHPGYVVGQLQTVSANNNRLDLFLYKLTGSFAGTYETGAIPALYAAAGEGALVGEFYGPDGWFRGLFRGEHPKALMPNKLAGDEGEIRKLWEVSEEMTGCTYNF